MRRPTRTAPRRLALLGAVLFLSGCDLFGPSGPGTLNATLTSTADLGAVVVELRGPAITGVEPQGSTRAYSAQVSPTEGVWRVVLVSPAAGPMTFGILVDDLGAEPPAVTVVTAANTQNLPALATGIEVRVER